MRVISSIKKMLSDTIRQHFFEKLMRRARLCPICFHRKIYHSPAPHILLTPAQTMLAIPNEVGVNLKDGYNGDLTSREAGSVGGQMVKNVFPI